MDERSTPLTSLLIHADLDDLRNLIADVVRSEVSELHESLKDLEGKLFTERMLTRKEAAAYLNITTATLRKYVVKGRVKANYLGSRVLFRQADLDEALH